LQDIGFSIDGAYAKYIKMDSRYLWSLEGLREIYGEEKMWLLGSLVEPCSVAYNAVIECGGGIRAGEHVVILGGGPIGIAACAVLRKSGANSVIISEPSEKRRKMALDLGATHAIDPLKVNAAEAVLDITKGMATDWGKYNIQVNGIAPGYFKTEMTKALYEDPKFDAWLCSRVPANRWGDPSELIGAAIFLSSKASDYVNGHLLFVDGGLMACV